MTGAAVIEGAAHVYGDNVDTDVIIPARYLTGSDAFELAKHCMEDLDPTFAGRVRPGEVVVAGRNFGCGSSREHAPIAIRGAGVACVVAESFARIFFRNAINVGLPVVECPGVTDGTESGDRFGVIPGDGTGPEVVAEGLKALDAVRDGFAAELVSFDLGGARYLRTGETLPDSVLQELLALDAIYLGAIGHPDVPPGILERE